jgi:phosphatidylserine/phosphatidylglycerophosphate/cardiolipin synthase-like enzyme
MTAFARIAQINGNTRLTDPANVPVPANPPNPRYVSEPVLWVSVAGGTSISAFARCTAQVFTGSSPVFSGSATMSWTLIELAPLAFFAPQTLLHLRGGLPVMYVLLSSPATSPISTGALSTAVAAGQVVANTSASATPSAWFGLVMQDRILRDPALWSKEIADAITASGGDASNWAPFAADLQTLVTPGLPIFILDHVGRPFAVPPGNLIPTFTVTTSSGSTIVTPSGGNTGVSVPANGPVRISFSSAAHPIVAGVESENGAFESPYQLPPTERYVQAIDADAWLDDRETPQATQLSRWNPNSFLEPIPDGNPYFARLVEDMRATIGGGGVGLAGWAFVKESLLDKTQDWPLVPGDDSTQFLNLVKTLTSPPGPNPPSPATVRLLVNRFLQVENNTFDDGDTVLATLWAFFAATFPLTAFGAFATDPAGFGVLFGCMAAALFLIDTSWTVDILRDVAESSKSMVDGLTQISADIANWSPYPATTSDNPLYVPPFQLAGITVDDIIHFGVYHQKFVVGKTGGGDFFGYLGGIDINSDRPDSPIHRALFPYHDVQARLTGPALRDLIQSFAERSDFDHVTLPFPVPTTVNPAGSHLVQIGRTYYKPHATAGFPFAPQGETLIHRSNLRAIRAARDFIYIEEQYFTPDDEYLDALCDAAGHAQALIITLCMQNGQVYGPIRRTQAISKLANVWGPGRLRVGALIRRHLNPTPATNVNLGRLVLQEDLPGGQSVMQVGPTSHVPEPPFWAFVGGELMQVESKGANVDPNKIALNVNRGPMGTVQNWGAKVDTRPKGSPVMCVRVPNIYVHAKLMIVDDVFVSIGSANMNRRGHFHDGEINALALPQHLKRDPANPARVLRCRLWGEHLGLTPEMGLSLLADPLSALSYFDRPWLAGNHHQPLSWSDAPTDTEQSFSSSDSLMSDLLTLAMGGVQHLEEHTVWPVLVDPTSFSDPNPASTGPEV